MIAAEYMSPQDQNTTLVIAFMVAAVIVAGIWAIAVECKDRWGIEEVEADIADFADDFLLDRDPHGDDVRDAMQGRRAG